jgi:hypothetical protein
MKSKSAVVVTPEPAAVTVASPLVDETIDTVALPFASVLADEALRVPRDAAKVTG